jgi:hypothetical protein
MSKKPTNHRAAVGVAEVTSARLLTQYVQLFRSSP